MDGMYVVEVVASYQDFERDCRESYETSFRCRSSNTEELRRTTVIIK